LDNKCIVCGEVIPEGRQVCPKCEADRNARFDYAIGIKAQTVTRVGRAVGVIAAIIVILISITLSWLITCGLIKAITLCFGWVFSLKAATLVWLAGPFICLPGMIWDICRK
jgi:hypothetical protein